MQATDVLIVGAGPTGLALALWLTKQGVAVRIIDKSGAPGEKSRAMAFQARTLELYRQLDIAESVVEAGCKTPAMNIWARVSRRARLPLVDSGGVISPYTFVPAYPQVRHDRLLVKQLKAFGIEVERYTELLSFEDKGSHVSSVLRYADKHQEVFTTLYLAGCDGARSLVRHQIGSGFERGTYEQLFYVADITATAVDSYREHHVAFDQPEFLMNTAHGKPHLYWLIGVIREDRAQHRGYRSFSDVHQDTFNGRRISISNLNWFSTYRVHHRVADKFRHGRTFLLGDAAHVHSSAGDQGMNTGILDAINLAWKLAAYLKGVATVSLLDSYQEERRASAHKHVVTTEKTIPIASARGGVANFVRARIAPILASAGCKSEEVCAYMFRNMAQTTLNYHESHLSQGKAGGIQGGDRLPWVSVAGADNYESLRSIEWQIHVYGEAKADLVGWCERNAVRLHVFNWQLEHQHAGMAKDAAYLLRPDTYVALADPDGESATLDRYYAEHGLIIPVGKSG